MDNLINITFNETEYYLTTGEIILFIILTLYLIINISGIIEIIKKKYPQKILILVTTLIIFQTFSLLGSEGDLSYNDPLETAFSTTMTYYIAIIAYYIGYFISGILSTIILLVYINYHDKLNNKNISLRK